MTVQELKQSLPPDVVLVDLHTYMHSSPDKEGEANFIYESRYVVFVVHHDPDVIMLDLGSTVEIDPAIQNWRSTFGRSTASRRAGELLRKKLWLPIEEHLAGKAKF